jgi:putative ABC transport system permease protein
MTEFRHTLRFLATHQSFTAAAVLTLAIGLGANTALFGLVNVVLRPLDIPEPDRLVAIAADTPGDDSGGFQYSFSLEALYDLQRRTTSFAEVFGVMPRIGGFSSGGKPAQFFFTAVSDNYFPAMGIGAHLGTLFTRRSGSPAAIVLGHTFWLKQFGGDPGVIGRHVRVNGNPAVVTGIVPAGFRGTFLALELDGYVSVEDLGVIDPDVQRWLYHNRKPRPLQLFGRLRPGVSVSAAGVEVNAVLQRLGGEYPETDGGLTARVVPEPFARPLPHKAVTRAIPVVRSLALVIAGLVLLIACLNVANLLLVRAAARQRELAIRSALGASAGRLIWQMVLEGLVIAGLGGIAGVLVGHAVTKIVLERLDLGADLPFAIRVGFDLRVFTYSLAATMTAGIGISLWPAWRASRADARAALHDGGRSQSDGRDRQHLRTVLVVGQIAGSLALLVVAALFAQTLAAARNIELGFDADHLITVRLDARQVGYDDDRSGAFYDQLLSRVRAWGDVASAALAFNVPMTYLASGGTFHIEGQPTPAGTQPPAGFLNHVGHDYFDVMQIPIVRGRAFTRDDEEATPFTRRLAIVNEAMAERYWPDQDPIGKRLRVYGPTEPLLEVVGVARNSKYVLVFEPPRPFVYLPLEKTMKLRTLHVRAKGDPSLLAPRLEHEIADLSRDLPIAELQTMRHSLTGIFGYFIFELGAVQAAGMGILGLALALVGVYGVVSFGASLRTREVGIRMALGAQPSDVLRLILGQGVSVVAVGLIVGLAVAWALGRALTTFIPLARADWFVFLGVALVLGALAIWACYVPARRATRVPAMTALRHE